MEPEIRKADLGYKKRVLVMFAVIFSLLLVGYLIIHSLSQRWIQNDGNTEAAIQKGVYFVKTLAYSVSIVSLLLSLYFLRIGIIILRYKEFPPKTMKVMFDTPIKREKKAVEKGVLSIVISALILAIAIIFPIYTFKILSAIGL